MVIKLYVKSSQTLSNGTLLHSKIKPLALKRGGLELTKTVNSLEVLETQTVFSIPNYLTDLELQLKYLKPCLKQTLMLI